MFLDVYTLPFQCYYSILYTIHFINCNQKENEIDEIKLKKTSVNGQIVCIMWCLVSVMQPRRALIKLRTIEIEAVLNHNCYLYCSCNFKFLNKSQIWVQSWIPFFWGLNSKLYTNIRVFGHFGIARDLMLCTLRLTCIDILYTYGWAVLFGLFSFCFIQSNANYN